MFCGKRCGSRKGGRRYRHEISFFCVGEDEVGELIPGPEDAEEFAAVAEDKEEFFWRL